ncbi:MAG: hypothetical protein MJ091_02885 [Clostridia bacterium]|nr:hypothetical protein [Clostridia bacterium]
MAKEVKKYFLAANSCEGFLSCFKKNYSPKDNWHALIIKGGPGTGKSSLLKYMAVKASDKGYNPVLCPCSSDPDSLDGVIIEEKKLIILDGTLPHAIEPEAAGYCEEIINLGDFWNRDKLVEFKDEIIALSAENKKYHNTASRYLAAAGQLMYDNFKRQSKCVKYEKLQNFAIELSKRYIKKGEGEGKEYVRFLSGTTPKGIITYQNTVKDIKTRIITDDKYGAVSNVINDTVRKRALICGYTVITVKNPFLPSEITDHIIIPELDLCFLTENRFCKFYGNERRIHTRRFCDVAALNNIRSRMIFNNRISLEMLKSAALSLSDAKRTHDRIEKYYVDSMNFEKAAVFCQALSEKIL